MNRTPLIIRWTDKINNRDKNTGLTAYAVGKVFTGITLPDETNLNDYIMPGIVRITNNIGGTKPPITDTTGYLQVIELNRDEETKPELASAIRVRQIVFPDSLSESAPYTRVGEGWVGYPITWNEWGMMGGGALRRVVLNDNRTALTNVMYESFADYTLTLPDPATVAVGTRIGLEQYLGTGKVVCGDQELVTPSDIIVANPEDITNPAMVSSWTRHTGEQISYGQYLDVTIVGENLITITNATDTVVNGSYTKDEATGQQAIYTKATEQEDPIYIVYNVGSKQWEITSDAVGLGTTYYTAEYAFTQADAVEYVFECMLNDDGVTREWILEVGTNHALTINILSGRIGATESDLEFAKECVYPTKGRMVIQHPSNILLNSKLHDPQTVADIRQTANDTANMWFYDHEIQIHDTTATVLPDAATTPIGASITYMVHGEEGREIVLSVSDDEGDVVTISTVADEVIEARFVCITSRTGNTWSMMTMY